MFDFTTTTFIHSADQFEANPASKNHSKATENLLRVDNKMFKIEDVVAIYRNPFVNPSNAKLFVDVDTFMSAQDSSIKRFKLDFYLRRSGDVNSYYSNAFVFKGKDFHYEWTTKHNTAAKVAKLIRDINRLYGDIYMNVHVEDGKLVFENDNYGIFTEATLSVFVPQQSDCCSYREGGWEVKDSLLKEVSYCKGEANCSNELGYDLIPMVESEAKYMQAYQGVNGHGTYEQIIKDLRLPTMENFRWNSPNAVEMPVPGNKYVQYTFHQISCRGVLGGSAVGEVTHSKTTHVFFVPACGCGDDLDTALQAAIKDAGMEDLLITTTEGRKADGSGPAIISDRVTDPADTKQPVYDKEKKAKTVNDGTHLDTVPTPEPDPDSKP